MKKLLLSGFLLLSVTLPLLAQVSISIEFNRDVYMQHEPVFVRVNMRNYSGQPLVFGGENALKGELLFDIVGPDRVLLPFKSSTPIPIAGTILRSGETKSFVVQLSKYYSIKKNGRYRCHAYIKHNMLKDMFKSKDISFSVAPGVTVWSARAGMPNVLGDTEGHGKNKVEERFFCLKILSAGGKRYYYLQLEDKNKIYAIYRVGQEVGVEKYNADLDMLSRLHLLMPMSPKIYRYNVINLSGQVEVDRYMKSTTSQPRLIRDPENGVIRVVGGAEALPGVDYQVSEK